MCSYDLVDPSTGGLSLVDDPQDPRFAKLYSGLYWQVRDETRATSLRSISLWDAELPIGETAPPPGELRSAVVPAPEGGPTLSEAMRIVLNAPEGQRAVPISVAGSSAEIEALRSGFQADLLPGFALLAAALLAGAWVQARAGLRPVARIGEGVQAIRTGQAARLDPEVPSEVRPLVDELNRLLELQREEMTRARDRAADLAHGLKTPLTALQADVRRLRASGEDQIADDIEALGSQMRRTVERELVRVRARYSVTGATGVAVAPAAKAIAAIVARTPQGEAKTIEVHGDPSLTAAVDPDDLNEILGNVIENAVRSAASRVDVAVQGEGDDIVVEIGDDGAGTDPKELAQFSERGRRHDEKGGSAGLGLAIVSEILAIHGRQPEFAISRFGGIAVRLRLPSATGNPKR